jgi:hypothetical protein
MLGWLKTILTGNGIEKRSAASGFTAELIQAREAYISGRRGIAELTATAQSCVSLWEGCFALADVQGTDLLDRRSLALIGRSIALRGEAVFLIRDRLIPCSDWDLKTRDGRPVAYRVSVPEAGGGRSQTALAGEVLHLRIGCDPAAPYYGTAPLKRASLTAGMLQAVETALAEVFENAPIGSQVVPMPEQPDTDNAALGRSFRGQRGRVLLRESVSVTAAGGPAPAVDWRPASLSPDIEKSMSPETLSAAREAVCMAFGVLPGLANAATTGPLVREAQRHLAGWTLQPIAMLLAEEAAEKLGGEVSIDVLRPVQAFDAGGRARALATIVQALAQAKEAGLAPGDMNAALTLVNWGENDGAA